MRPQMPTPTPTPPQLLLAAALLAGLLAPTDCADWAYTGPHGPDNWPKMCQGGNHQSPLDIGGMGIEERHFESLAMIHYSGARNMTLTNNGHTVQLVVHHPNTPTLSAGGLHGVYLLDQAHFHWPSEHTLLGKSYPLELHFVHHERRFQSLEKALTDDEGVTVLGVLFHESDTPNPSLEPLLEGVTSVIAPVYASRGLRRPLDLKALLPHDTNKFYRYHGSLTTPGCDESVVWTIFTETVSISKQQLQKFQQVMSSTGGATKSNNRPLQQQNNRIVYFQSGPGPRVAWTFSGGRRPERALAVMAALVAVARFL